MKHSLKFFRYSCILLLALIVAFSAAIGVSASEYNPTTNYNYCYEIDDTGIIILSEYPLYLGQSSSNNIIIGSTNSFTLLTPLGVSYGDKIQYQIFDVDYPEIWFNLTYDLSLGMYNYTYNRTDTIIPALNPIQYMLNPQSVLRYIRFNQNGSVYNMVQTLNNINKIYVAGNTDNYYNDINGYPINSYSVEYNSTLELWFEYYSTNQNNSNIINNINNTNQILNGFNDHFEQISQNQEDIDELLYQIITYGSNYNQIDSTIINNLGTAEDRLSSAEDALENKSTSLKHSVASQWSTIQSTSKTFITNIAPAAAAIGTVTTQLLDSAPSEVQGLFVTIPLLIFIGWLIGRIRGD